MLATRRERVTIDGREFELGAIYGPQKGSGSRWRKLVAFEPSEDWCGGKVVTQIISPTALRSSYTDAVSGLWWARWAGEQAAELRRSVAL
jgi:hypothetical protein